MIRIVLIDPEAGTVTEQTLHLNLGSLYSLIGCNTVDSFSYGGAFCYCDGEGLFREPDANGMLPQVWLKRADQPIVGRIVVVGRPDQNGNETDCTLSCDDVKAWVDRYEIGPLGPIPEPKVYVLR